MPKKRKFANNAWGTLASSITSTDTTITLTAGHGARFPTLGTNEVFLATLIDSSNNLEIIEVTARSTDTLTVVRGQEGTTARAYGAGDRIELRVTRGVLESVAQKDEDPVFTSHVSLSGTQVREDKGADIVAAATTDLGTATGNYVTITHASGTLAITSLGGASLPAGTEIETRFSISGGTLSLTHNATNLILPGGVDLTLANGDVLRWRKEHDSNAEWRCVGMRPIAERHTIWIPATAMIARTTNGPASGTVETTTNKVMVKTLDFDPAADEFAQFTVRMPKSWDKGTVSAVFLWSNASGTGDVVWGIQAVAISDDDVLDAAFGSAQTVTDSVTAAGDLMQSAETGAVTIGGTPVANDLVVFQVYRDADAAGDTLTVDARLHGVVLFYKADVTTDA